MAAWLAACGGSVIGPGSAGLGGPDGSTGGGSTPDGGGQGGGGSDAGGGGSDAGPGPSTDGGCPAGALLCEDFENGLDAGLWQQDLNLGTLALETTRAVSGAHSLHAHIQSAGDARAYIYTSLTFPNDNVFGRAWVYMTSPAPVEHSTYFMAAQATPWSDYSLGIQFQDLLINAYWSASGNEAGQGSSTAVPTDRWACYEWQFDGVNGAINIWLDGQPVTDLSRTGLTPVSFDQAWFGLRIVSADSTAPAFDVWLDDLALSGSRIGCP